MASTIGQRELRNDNARIIDAVAAGQSFVVTRHGTPVAELRPVEERRPRFVSRSALVAAAASGSHIDAARFRADLDRALDQGL
jgi:prevent-host-death family protein